MSDKGRLAAIEAIPGQMYKAQGDCRQMIEDRSNE
jgi:hypothetical protein